MFFYCQLAINNFSHEKSPEKEKGKASFVFLGRGRIDKFGQKNIFFLCLFVTNKTTFSLLFLLFLLSKFSSQNDTNVPSSFECKYRY